MTEQNTPSQKEIDMMKLEIILRRFGGRKGYKSYLIGVIICLAVALFGGLAIFIMYVENLRQ